MRWKIHLDNMSVMYVKVDRRCSANWIIFHLSIIHTSHSRWVCNHSILQHAHKWYYQFFFMYVLVLSKILMTLGCFWRTLRYRTAVYLQQQNCAWESSTEKKLNRSDNPINIPAVLRYSTCGVSNCCIDYSSYNSEGTLFVSTSRSPCNHL